MAPGSNSSTMCSSLPSKNAQLHPTLYGTDLFHSSGSLPDLNQKASEIEPQGWDAVYQVSHQNSESGVYSVGKNKSTDGCEYRQVDGSPSMVFSTGRYSAERVPARKVHKADREKLRRNRQNELFADLALVLDPSRPKNDKASILSDGLQRVRDLQAEIDRLKCEQVSLLNESHELESDREELHQEKASLKTQLEHLQAQFQQSLQFLPVTPNDPSIMPDERHSPAASPQQPILVDGGRHHENQQETSLYTPAPCLPFPAQIQTFYLRPPVNMGALHINGHGESSNFRPSTATHYRVERPQAQYLTHQRLILDLLPAQQASIAKDVEQTAGEEDADECRPHAKTP